MNIFGIVGLAFLISVLVFLIALLCNVWRDDISKKTVIVIIALSLCTWVFGVFAGIGLYTDSEVIYVQKFNSRKQTIESSLTIESLSDLEKIGLVNKAVDLNSEFAERKARFSRWYFVAYDKSIYDNVEMIAFRGNN